MVPLMDFDSPAARVRLACAVEIVPGRSGCSTVDCVRANPAGPFAHANCSGSSTFSCTAARSSDARTVTDSVAVAPRLGTASMVADTTTQLRWPERGDSNEQPAGAAVVAGAAAWLGT